MLKFHPGKLWLLSRGCFSHRIRESRGMHRFYSGIKARPTLTVLPWTLSSIWKEPKRGPACDGNTSSEMNEHWGVFWARVKSHGREAGKCDRHRHKEKGGRSLTQMLMKTSRIWLSDQSVVFVSGSLSIITYGCLWQARSWLIWGLDCWRNVVPFWAHCEWAAIPLDGANTLWFLCLCWASLKSCLRCIFQTPRELLQPSSSVFLCLKYEIQVHQ